MSSVQLVHERGFWLFGDPENIRKEHIFDEPLAKALSERLHRLHVIDFGCGTGEYVRYLRSRGYNVRGYDGNPHTKEISHGHCQVLDLSHPVMVDPADWVLCLEVGEHIPAKYESVLLDNIATHAKFGAVVSWCIPVNDWPAHLNIKEERGLGHVNCRTNEYIREQMHSRGFGYLPRMERTLREASRSVHFKHTLMCFRRLSA